MSIISRYHLPYIQMRPIQDFCREEKIVFSSYNIDDLVANINQLVMNGELESDLLIKKLDQWTFQGRKKIVFRYLDTDVLGDIRDYEVFKNLVESNLIKSNQITDISKLRPDVEDQTHLIDVKYDYNDRNILRKVIFLFAKVVKYIKNEGEIIVNKPIALPVHVVIDFENNEIHSRITAKTDIYDFDSNKITDIEIAISYMKSILNDLGLNGHINDSDRDMVEKSIYRTHKIITKLPEEIDDIIKCIEVDSSDFIKIAGDKLSIDLSDETISDLKHSINNLFIKEIIKTYSSEQKDIFTKDNFAFSTSITASGKSLSKLRHSAPAKEPIHSIPEYQNVRSILDETEVIDKNTIHWKSIVKENTFIRSKLFIHNKDYGIISFEEYVYEEDINNVFSKIRESKPARII